MFFSSCLGSPSSRGVLCNILVSAVGMFSWRLPYVVLLFRFSGGCPGAHKSPTPTACTLLSVLGHATSSFPALAAFFFVVFLCVSYIFDLAKQRRENLWGVSEVGKNDFSISFCWLCRFFLIFYFSPHTTTQHIFINASKRRICSATFQTQMSDISSEPDYSRLPLSSKTFEPKYTFSEDPLDRFTTEEPEEPYEVCSAEEDDADEDVSIEFSELGDTVTTLGSRL